MNTGHLIMKMKWEKAGYKSEMACATGLGSSHTGVKHWIHQRITAIAGLFLTIWFTLETIGLVRDGTGYEGVATWIKSGLTPVWIVLLSLALFYHAKLGLQVVIEDYIHGEGSKFVILTLTKLILGGLCAICIFSVLKIAL